MKKPELEVGVLAIGFNAYYQPVFGKIVAIDKAKGVARLVPLAHGEACLEELTPVCSLDDIPEREDIGKRLHLHANEHRLRMIASAEVAEKAKAAAETKAAADKKAAEETAEGGS